MKNSECLFYHRLDDERNVTDGICHTVMTYPIDSIASKAIEINSNNGAREDVA